MIDPSLMPELPAIPDPDGEITLRVIGRYCSVDAFRCSTMVDFARTYGLQCYQLAMERAADLAYDAAIRYSQGYAVDFKAEFALQEKTT